MIEPPVPTATGPRNSVETALSTFLLTDIEGSTRLWEEHADAMGQALAVHDRLLREAIEGERGTVIKTTGDGVLAVFDDPVAAVRSALAVQRALRAASWGETGPLRVRMALHTGAAEARDGDYFGPALNRVARILSIGHGGQVLASAVAAVLSRDGLPAAVELVDLGSHRLRDIDRPEQVYQVTAPDLPRSFPALRSLSTRRSNLPVQLTSFVGRETELAEVGTLIARHRLVTLIGTGGTGKTRLMLEVAARIGGGFADGAWLAELAPLGDAAQIPSEVARALGSPEVPGVPTMVTVTAFLADKDLLLLLDNAEHLVDGVATFAERLLAAAPRLRILTTSREALAVPGEAVLQLRSLSCPGARPPRSGSIASDPVDLDAIAATEAVRLFTERASAVDPDFALRESNVESVSEICRRLDGIPLAIELAAARVSALSPDEIAMRLGDRFRLLAGGRRTAVPRQQTLHALIDWSWDLLTDDDRRLLRRLSVFAGGWTVGTAARVVGDDLDGQIDTLDLLDRLTRLVDRSLVVVDRGPTTRYRMLETIRQYAREKLVAADEVRAVSDRHFAAFAALAAEAAPALRGPAMGDWLDRLDADADNLGVALEWGLESSPWAAVRMAADLQAYWTVRVASDDGDERTIAAIAIARERTVGKPDADPADQALAARLLGDASRLWAMGGRAQQAVPWARDGLELARASGDPTALVYALGGMAVTTVFAGTASPGGENVRAWFYEAADLAEQTGMWWIVAMAAGFAGATLAVFDPATAEALVRRGVEGGRRSGSPYAIAAASIAQGRMFGVLGRTDEAVESFQEAVERLTELGDERFALAARSDMAHALRRGGRLEEAAALYRQTIRGWVHLGHRGAVAHQLESSAFVAIELGDLARAALLLAAADVLREASGAHRAFDEEPEHDGYVARLREAMPGQEFEAAWRAGGSLSYPAAVELVTGG